MLVLSRKKHEAILIDGAIRIDVVKLGKATVHVRLRAPRCLAPIRGPMPKEGSPREDTSARVALAGRDDYMTLVNEQVVSLGESISLGVVDADKSRALFFVDAPQGISVKALKPQSEVRPASSDHQHFLQFMSQSSDQAEHTQDQPKKPSGAIGNKISAEDPLPRLLPFPVREPRRRQV
jgi:sRNA-binding carbon storage regulator CsrA